MRVFMLGWEFPPFISGGLGTACYGLTKAMSSIGTDVMFVLPRPVTSPFSTHVRLVSPRPNSPLAMPSTEFRLDEFERVTFRTVDASFGDPYERPAEFRDRRAKALSSMLQTQAADPLAPKPSPASLSPAPAGETGGPEPAAAAKPNGHYSGDLFSEIQRYAALAAEISRQESFDVVHAHDWMTFPAGLAVAGIRGVPLVVHVHSTEFDRSGVNVDQRIYDIERRGMHGAIRVIAVSHLTKNIIVHHYGVEPSKVEVVYNAIENNGNGSGNGAAAPEQYQIHKDEKLVLFLGRITMQKGPEYFLAAAKKVLEVMDNVKFVMAGSGETGRQIGGEATDSVTYGRRILARNKANPERFRNCAGRGNLVRFRHGNLSSPCQSLQSAPHVHQLAHIVGKVAN